MKTDNHWYQNPKILLSNIVNEKILFFCEIFAASYYNNQVDSRPKVNVQSDAKLSFFFPSINDKNVFLQYREHLKRMAYVFPLT